MRRISTGIAELDVVLNGGLLPGSLAVIAGAPGSGKTILAQQICFSNAHPDAKAIYYATLSEPHSKLVDHLEGFSFFDPGAIGTAWVRRLVVRTEDERAPFERKVRGAA